MYTNNIPPTTMKGDDRKINLGISWYGYFLRTTSQVLVEHSSPDWRSRRGADTQQTVYAQTLVQVRWGGRTTRSMKCKMFIDNRKSENPWSL